MARQVNVRDGLHRQNSASTSNTNVFSDDYALDSQSSMGDRSPVDSTHDSVDPSDGYRENPSSDPGTSTFTTAAPIPVAAHHASSSTAKEPLPAESCLNSQRPRDSLAPSDAGTTRSLSTSSRFSIPRPASPYTGPTAPSQPYAMYPQVTRASSIASESTVRPIDRPFVAQGGPEHPYAMYQNTVPEEDDEPSSNVILNGATTSPSFHGSRSSGNDTGDIVGTDGHVETLPPYTRYADNSIAKGNMNDIDHPRTSVVEADQSPTEPPTEPSTEPSTDRSVAELTPVATDAMEDAEARKEGWRSRAKSRKCCGMPCWVVLLVSVVIFVAAALSGIMGGVIGNQQGVEAGKDASHTTTTVWLDADPVSTGGALPPCPTGHFTMMLNQTQRVQQCIADSGLQQAGTWDCMDIASLGLWVFDAPNYPTKVVFDDYSLRPQLFRYGPQPPDFNQTQFELSPVKDRVDSEYGVALFFSSLFDKIVILEEDQIDAQMAKKRSVPASHLRRRNPPREFGYLAVGDNPWYCFWNSTVEEFWIFLERSRDGSPASTTSAAAQNMTTSTPTPPFSAPGSGSFPSGYGPNTAATAAATTSMTSNAAATPSSAPTSSWTGPGPNPNRRAFPDTQGSPEFPKLVKMVEKRKPHSNIQPYCQQMEVKPNWQIVPCPDVGIVYIRETEYNEGGASDDSKRLRSRLSRRSPAFVQQLESTCICEWMSG